MSDPIFAGSYARLYDAMYAGKDYAHECDAVGGATARYGDGGAYRAILDLGCGTGNHSVALARRGYDVAGVDLSEDMLAIARAKAAAAGVRAAFDRGDMRDTDVGRTFDVVLILFAALGYQTEDAAVAGTLANARRHLRAGGLLLLDVWNAPTLLREGAPDRVSVVERPGGQLIKASTRTLRPGSAVVDVRMRVWEIEGTTLTGSADETHRMRAFARPELERFLAAAGLVPRAFFAFPDLDRPVREGTFDLGCVAAT
ncbi:MAG: class I SAM-dependent methyltransferase [Chloroflexi bacterium]|nr:class I SAM-dependent methyltransferase [Chloroflexota bacterium]